MTQLLLVIMPTCVIFMLLILKVISELMAPKLNLHGAHCIVTGGSQGIGKEVAKELSRRGAHVTIVARRQSILDEARAEILEVVGPQGTTDVNTVALDLAGAEKDVATALDAVCNKYGGCDVLVCNAGTSVSGLILDTPSSDYSRMFNVNVLGTLHTIKAVLPHMYKRGRGRIAIVASQLAQLGMYGYSAYCASKWGLRGLAESLQMEENQTKPAVVKELEDASATFPPHEVAKALVRGIDKCIFNVALGVEGWLLCQLTAGFAPVTNVFEFAIQVLCASLARFVSLVFSADMYSKVRKSELAAGTGKLKPE